MTGLGWPEANRPGQQRWPSFKERFFAKVNKNGPIPEHRPSLGVCWLWTASQTAAGYGHFWNGNSVQVSHRFLYEVEVGPIQEGLELDHLCRTPLCVRPSHMEPVTGKVNTLRSTNFTALNAQKTHCPYGHPYDLFNTAIDREGRHCRQCWREKAARRKQVLTSATVPAAVPPAAGQSKAGAATSPVAAEAEWRKGLRGNTRPVLPKVRGI